MLLIIFLYEVLVPKIVKEGNRNRGPPPNDCSRQQENTAMKQQEEIDDLNGKLSRFEQELKKIKKIGEASGLKVQINEKRLKNTQKLLAKSKAEVKNPKKE
tara:strand:+ start:327 stop:629 length:303 start_codon:yes stop_codon:yes gene_type:complete